MNAQIQAQPVPVIFAGAGLVTAANKTITDETSNKILDENGNEILGD